MRFSNPSKLKGFTLIEVMVVVVILGILAMVVVPKVMGRPEQARELKAKQDILALESALELYRLDNGEFPTTEQGLQSLVKKPEVDPRPMAWKTGGYIKEVPQDPWGHLYQYANPGSHAEIDIFSYGPKGPSNSDEKDWITNWGSGAPSA